MQYRFLTVAFLLLSLVSCTPEESQDDAPKVYYDLKGFIENQIVYLDEQKPQVTKTAVLRSKQETTKTNRIDWKKELELFAQSDINKPSYRQSYEMVQNGPVVFEYRLKPGNDLPVTYLKINADSLLKQPLYVEAHIRVKNKIYESEKKLVLRAAKQDNLVKVNEYEVNGHRQLIFGERTPFRIQGKIGL